MTGKAIEGVQKVVDGIILSTFGAVKINYYIGLIVGTGLSGPEIELFKF
ncbi:Putative protein [Zobellia galactanivorans]|uniref:Uncharacterized protein n=1 Tax=Zobellia galactanivorans (strain DSM 12802 / CCUG 47099 / CIP 106680 / NCIMB 13871 / Dsij) TaxID=63186 RepID=G0L9E3_ZOBGA|nr:Putative protein [Zobellia galactanivorans]